MKNKYLLALSGGVDSAVAAAMLLKEGNEVIGVTMDIGLGNAPSEAAIVAKSLGIPHYVLDIRQEFNQKVMSYFKESYLGGQTPNPCVICNKEIKFKVFQPLMEELNADYIATGHYIRKVCINNRFTLKKAAYLPKDQSYFLYMLSQSQLEKAVFPLGEFNKEQIREKARLWNLPVAQKKDSQDICFITQGGYKEILEDEVGKRILPGPIKDKAGKIIGKHNGLPYYTVGQRKGLGLFLPRPSYVVAIDLAENALIVGEEEDIYTSYALTTQNNFLLFDKLEDELEVEVKVRYNARPVKAKIRPYKEEPEKNGVLIEFASPEKAVAPGQAGVFYQGDILIGGGKIEKTLKF